MKLLVLAAGMGSRFGGVKQLVSIGSRGETLLEYNIYDALSAGFDEIVFLIRHEIEEDFRETVLSRLPPDVRVSLAFQTLLHGVPAELLGEVTRDGRTKPWGTGHALLCAKSVLGTGRFAVINADDFYGRKGFAAVGDFLGKNPRGTLCLAGYRLADVVPPQGKVSRAVCEMDADGRLERIVEHVRVYKRDGVLYSFPPEGAEIVLSTGRYASMNLWGLDDTVFPWAERLFRRFLEDEGRRSRGEFYLPDIVGAMVRDGGVNVRVLPVKEAHFGLTNPDDLPGARSAIARRVAAREYPEPLWATKDGADASEGMFHE